MERLWALLTADFTPEQQKGAMIVMMRCAQWGFIFWAAGLLTFIGLPGFVRAGDLKDVQQKVAEVDTAVQSILSDILETRIMQNRVSQCNSEPGSNARIAYGERLNELVRRYRESTGKDYRIPACDEVR